MEDLEIRFVRQSLPKPELTAYLVYTPSQSLIWPLPTQILDLLDPVKQVGVSIVNNNPHIIILTQSSRVLESRPLKLEDGVTFTFVVGNSTAESITLSYFDKYDVKIFLSDCYCITHPETTISLVSDKFHKNVACSLGNVPRTDFQIDTSLLFKNN